MEAAQDHLLSYMEALGMNVDAPSHGKRHAKAARGKRGGK